MSLVWTDHYRGWNGPLQWLELDLKSSIQNAYSTTQSLVFIIQAGIYLGQNYVFKLETILSN